MKRIAWTWPFHRISFLTLTLPLVLVYATISIPALGGINDLEGTKPGELESGGKFLNADGCAQCHGGGFMGDTTYLPFDSWAGTMMANAARDPVFLAALAVANQDAPGVGTFCIRCHTPIAFVRGHAVPPDGSALDAVDRQGIGCEVCHRASSSMPPKEPYFLGNAQLVFTNDTAKHGPYADSISPSHTTIEDLSLKDSRFCGQCHQVTNPERNLKDENGVDLGVEFPLDTTFEEWASSDFSKPGNSFASCIDCHMPKRPGMLPVATPLDSKLRQDPREHGFAGGNLWGIEAVMKAAPARAATYAYAFENAILATKATLSAAVKVTIQSSPTVVLPNDPLVITVRVQNLTGHKFPTGYAESRRAWLAVTLVDPLGTERTLVGGYDDTTGTLVADPMLRVYRAQHGRFTGGVSEPEDHLVLHDRIISDTRIPPSGFSPSITTIPIGNIDYKDGSGSFRDYDEVSYNFMPPAGAEGEQTLSVRVFYQSMTREYIEALAAANTTNSAGDELKAIYEATNRAPPILIASAEASLYLGVPKDAGGGGNPSAGMGGSGAGASSSGANGTGGGVGGMGGIGGPAKPAAVNCDCRAIPGGEDRRDGDNGGASRWIGGSALIAALSFFRLRSKRRELRRCSYCERNPSAGRRRAA